MMTNESGCRVVLVIAVKATGSSRKVVRISVSPGCQAEIVQRIESSATYVG